MNVQELFTPVACAANSTTIVANAGNACALGGFLCTTAGNITVQDGSGTTIVAAVALSVSQFCPLPFAFGNGCSVVLSGGCAGTLAVSK